MDADEALLQAWNLGIDTGWTDAVIDEAERLLPTLIAAGYADADEKRGRWRFTPKASRARPS